MKSLFCACVFLIFTLPAVSEANVRHDVAFGKTNPSTISMVEFVQQHYEALGGIKETQRDFVSAIEFYERAGEISIKNVPVINGEIRLFCSAMTVVNTKQNIRVRECESFDPQAACEEKKVVDIVRCSATENLCKKIHRVWKELFFSKNLEISDELPCAPYKTRAQ